MGYSNPAIALLLATASARVGIANQSSINALFPDYAGTQPTGVAQILVSVPAAGNAASTLLWTPVTYLESCMNCIRSGNIWCSASQLTEKAGVFAIPMTWAASATTVSGPFATNIAISATQDLGVCCWLNSDSYKDQSMPDGWMSMTAYTAKTDSVKLFNKWLCPARFTNDAGTTMCAGSGLNVVCESGGLKGTAVTPAEVATAWWCSNGRQNVATTATNSILKYWVPGSGSQKQGIVTTYSANSLALNANGNGDSRMDLMLTACRQNTTTCSGTAAITTIAAITTTANAAATNVRTIAVAFTGKTDKCTFVHSSLIGAPTFKIEKSGTNYLLAAYDVHYAEYTSDAWMQPGLTANIPLINTTWANLRARLYNTATGSTGNGLQQNPNVWMWVDAAAASGAGFGLKRWFPTWMAQNQIKLQNSVYSTFTSAVGTYTPLKTAYDTAVKTPPKKLDAFAVLFNTVKKVTIPLRPSVPSTPGAYAGPYQAPFPTLASSYTNASSQQSTVAVTANQFVADGSRGGFGGWTMGFLGHTSATAATVEKSFGVFGWGMTTTTPVYNAQGQSYTSNWKQMCFAAATNGACPSGFTTYNTALKAIVAVSVWANTALAAGFGTGSGGSSFKITFQVNNWAQNSAAWAAPTAPAAATAPNTPATGAKALVASAAAAAAVAAALY